MKTHNPSNERIKRQYFDFLKEAKQQSEASVDAVAKALARFEAETRRRDFKTFNHQQAVAFKRNLAQRDSQVTGGKLSKATQYATLNSLKAFFQWLATQPGFRSHVQYTDAAYFNLSDNDSRIATARRPRPAPTLEQVKHTLAQMPANTDIERRDRALVAFALLTGARDAALASLKLKHVDLVAGCVHQDARDVKTKFAKTFTTFFFPVGDGVRQIVDGWVTYLRHDKLWGNDDPLFPKTEVGVGPSLHFEAIGLQREHWSTATPIRTVFKLAFQRAGLPYFNPHSFRSTLVMLGETRCTSVEAFKSWSQNLGHEGVLTTLYSYGTVALSRQAEIIKSLGAPIDESAGQELEWAKKMVRVMREAGMPVP
jgi:integrase